MPHLSLVYGDTFTAEEKKEAVAAATAELANDPRVGWFRPSIHAPPTHPPTHHVDSLKAPFNSRLSQSSHLSLKDQCLAVNPARTGTSRSLSLSKLESNRIEWGSVVHSHTLSHHVIQSHSFILSLVQSHLFILSFVQSHSFRIERIELNE